ncbi:uncharacterized protein JN550_013677 [Neoarthrinium moseri]|uniref:uncharacterized protein n=1 Tax=Neoarthrinium moseri TaxID=1658444 RepID=UPI001FDD7496|nr:uncharacterized protein JN550_013677 [Neoarthrinium moseri]KAI1856710.1 hypothetical protein JN550_013677 [Neoarthrinium moseri]
MTNSSAAGTPGPGHHLSRLSRDNTPCDDLRPFLIAELYAKDIKHGDCHTMWWGCHYGRVDVIETAIKHGEPENRHFAKEHLISTFSRRLSPLVVAIRALQLGSVKCLLAHGADVHQPDKSPILAVEFGWDRCRCWYPIHWIFSQEMPHDDPKHAMTRYDILSTLLKAGADVNEVPSICDETSWMEDVDNDNIPVFEVDEGAPISMAMTPGISVDIVYLLLCRGADAIQIHQLAIETSVSGNALEILLQLPDSWLTVEGLHKFWMVLNHDRTRLMPLIQNLLPHILDSHPTPWKLKLLQELHEYQWLKPSQLMDPVGPFPDALGAAAAIIEFGLGPDWDDILMEATGRPMVHVVADMFTFILDSGATFLPEILSRAIFALCAVGDQVLDTIIAHLIKHHNDNAPVTIRGDDKNIAKSNLLSLHDNKGRTALHIAIDYYDFPSKREGNYKPTTRVSMLLRAGAPVNAKDGQGRRQLGQACSRFKYLNGAVEVINTLLDAGADVDAISDGEIPLMIMLRHLLNSYTGFEYSSNGSEALAAAKEIVQTLIQSGADPQTSINGGAGSPLNFAKGQLAKAERSW